MAGVRIFVAVIVAFVLKDAHSCSLGSHKSGLPCPPLIPDSATHDSSVISHHKSGFKPPTIPLSCGSSSTSNPCLPNVSPSLSSGPTSSSKSTFTPVTPITDSTLVPQPSSFVSAGDKQAFLNYLIKLFSFYPTNIPSNPQIPSVQQSIFPTLPTANGVPAPSHNSKSHNELFLPCSTSLPNSNQSPLKPLSSLPCRPISLGDRGPSQQQSPVQTPIFNTLSTTSPDMANYFKTIFPALTSLYEFKSTHIPSNGRLTPLLNKKSSISSNIKPLSISHPCASLPYSSSSSIGLPNLPCGPSSSSQLTMSGATVPTSITEKSPTILQTSTLALTSTSVPTPERVLTSTLAPTTEQYSTLTSKLMPLEVQAITPEGTLAQAPDEFPALGLVPSLPSVPLTTPASTSSVYNQADYLNNLHNWLLSIKTPTIMHTPFKPPLLSLPTLNPLLTFKSNTTPVSNLPLKPTSTASICATSSNPNSCLLNGLPHPPIPVLTPTSSLDLSSGYNPQFMKQLIKFWLLYLSSKPPPTLSPLLHPQSLLNANSVSSPIPNSVQTSNPNRQSNNQILQSNSLSNKLPDSNQTPLIPTIMSNKIPFDNNATLANNNLSSTFTDPKTSNIPCLKSTSPHSSSTFSNNPQLDQIIHLAIPCKPLVTSLSDLLLNKTPNLTPSLTQTIPSLIPMPELPSPVLKPFLELTKNKMSEPIPIPPALLPPPCLPPLPSLNLCHTKHQRVLASHLA